MLFIRLNGFLCQLLGFGDIGCRDVCFLSNIMELHGTQLVVLQTAKNTILYNSAAMQQCLIPEIMTQLNKIKIIYILALCGDFGEHGPTKSQPQPIEKLRVTFVRSSLLD